MTQTMLIILLSISLVLSLLFILNRSVTLPPFLQVFAVPFKLFDSKIYDSGDNSVEAHLVLFILSVLVFFGLVIYSVVVQNQTFSYTQFGEGLTLIVGGSMGGGLIQSYSRKVEGPSQTSDTTVQEVQTQTPPTQ